MKLTLLCLFSALLLATPAAFAQEEGPCQDAVDAADEFMSEHGIGQNCESEKNEEKAEACFKKAVDEYKAKNGKDLAELLRLEKDLEDKCKEE